MKYCNGCNNNQELALWSKNKSTKDGLSTRCKGCMKRAAALHYKNNKANVLQRLKNYHSEKGKYHSLKVKYGVNKEQYEELIKQSGGVCAICKKDFMKKEPFLDHCHSSGNIRGLLCNSCNVGLSRFRDNIDILNNAIKYLKNE